MVTQSEYLKYHLHPHQNESNHIFMAEILFQEYVVDGWATTEQFCPKLINFYNKVNTSVSTLVRVNNVSSLKH